MDLAVSGEASPVLAPDEEEARALARLGAAAAGSEAARLRRTFAPALAHVGPSDLEELLLQTYLFAGFPRAIDAFFVWRGWAVRQGLAALPRPVEPPDPAAWRERGEALCRRIYGTDYEALQLRLARLHPALAEWTLVEGYGKVLSRPGPDPARRELAAVGALGCLGAERQLRSHLKGAVRVGVRPAVVGSAIRAVAIEWGQESLVDRLLVELGWPTP